MVNYFGLIKIKTMWFNARQRLTTVHQRLLYLCKEDK